MKYWLINKRHIHDNFIKNPHRVRATRPSFIELSAEYRMLHE
jgi:hypothetical protein